VGYYLRCEIHAAACGDVLHSNECGGVDTTDVCVLPLVTAPACHLLCDGIHLVGDSVQHRLIHGGYLLHLSVWDNPIMKVSTGV
jgi:hypothetical protein